MLAAIKEAPRNHPCCEGTGQLVTKFFHGSSAKAIQALIRDGYRCVVSGIYDSIADSEDSEENLSITKAK
jgi:hypothetical protein